MRLKWTLPLLAVVLAFASPALAGPAFIGASVGNASIESDTPEFNFDESDAGWKVFGGYRFLHFFGVEGGYVDLGSPSENGFEVDSSGWDAYGVGILPLGPVELFAKVGMVSWDIEGSGPSVSIDDSGSDPAYGVGIAFDLHKIAIRIEFEKFDVDAVDNLYLATAGVEWRF